jgi:hypothetical protein
MVNVSWCGKSYIRVQLYGHIPTEIEIMFLASPPGPCPGARKALVQTSEFYVQVETGGVFTTWMEPRPLLCSVATTTPTSAHPRVYSLHACPCRPGSKFHPTHYLKPICPGLAATVQRVFVLYFFASSSCWGEATNSYSLTEVAKLAQSQNWELKIGESSMPKVRDLREWK